MPSRRPSRPPSAPYVPHDSQDVTAELAAMAGRGPNGRLSSSFADRARADLPAPTFRSDPEAQAVQRKLDGLAAEAYAAFQEGRASPTTVRDDGPERARDDAPAAPIGDRYVVPDELRQEAERAAVQIRQTAPPAPAAPRAAPVLGEGGTLAARLISAQDIDRLWDWLRQDPAGGQAFFGRAFASSVDLHRAAAELAHAAIIRALELHGQHAGFFLLWPIDQATNTTVLHLFLAPEVRHTASALYPTLLAEARRAIGPRFNLAVQCRDGTRNMDLYERVLVPYGFKPYVVYIQAGQSVMGSQSPTVDLGGAF